MKGEFEALRVIRIVLICFFLCWVYIMTWRTSDRRKNYQNDRWRSQVENRLNALERSSLLNSDSWKVSDGGNTFTLTDTVFTINPRDTLRIRYGQQLIIPFGKTLTNNGTMHNDGTITNNGTITNDGTMLNYVTITNDGTINNKKTMNNDGRITNNASGTITNDGTMWNNGTITNNASGTITNDGTMLNYVTITNDGTINNKKTMYSNGTITNNASGTITNDGTINNTGIPNGTITNDGTINNNGTITNVGTWGKGTIHNNGYWNGKQPA